MKKIDGRVKHQEEVIQTVLEFCKKYPDKKKEMADKFKITIRTVNRWLETDNDSTIETKANDISLALALNNVMMQLHGDNLKLVVSELIRINNEIAELKKDTSSELKTTVLEHFEWCRNHYKPKDFDNEDEYFYYDKKMAILKFAVMDFCKWLDDKKVVSR